MLVSLSTFFNLDFFASITTLISVLFLSVKKPIGWFISIFTCILYGILFLQEGAVFNAGLQVVYIAQLVLGTYVWFLKPKIIKSLSLRYFLGIIFGFGVLCYISSMDVATTIGSLIATGLMIFYYRESWLLWALIDIIYLMMFQSDGLWWSFGVYMILTLVCLWSYKKWTPGLQM